MSVRFVINLGVTVKFSLLNSLVGAQLDKN